MNKCSTILLSAAGSLAVAYVEAQGVTPPAPNSSPKQMEEVLVVGTRLPGHNVGQRLVVYDKDELRNRGLATIEDILRAIPENFVGLGEFNNNEMLFTVAGGISAGTQLANLRGMGSENTLVLVNGRRRAGLAGDDKGYFNIANMPAAMIERVEVLLSGGSAVYGSDAIGGVINFVTRKDYIGLSIHGRIDDSRHGGDKTFLDSTAGYNWSTGSIAGTASYSELKPVKNSKTGWKTSDYRYLFDRNPERFKGDRDDYDKRDDSAGQSGWVTLADSSTLSLPPDADGVDAEASDFIDISDPSTRDALRLDTVPALSGANTETWAISGSLRQMLGARLGLRAEFDWSRVEGERQVLFARNFFQVPASNAYNPFGESVEVVYVPTSESEMGLTPSDIEETVSELWGFNLGLDYQVAEGLTLSATYLRSESSIKGFRNSFTSNTTGLMDVDQKIDAILDEGDKDYTVNLFGNGTAQTALFSELFQPFDRDDETRLEQADVQLAGTGWLVPGGRIAYVLGVEARSEKLILPNDDSRLISWTGGKTPEREVWAFFAETSIPLIGPGNQARFARELTLNLQARYDDYQMDGADGRDDNGEPKLVSTRFNETSPRVSIVYAPVVEWELRASWSEAFRAPAFGQLFDADPLRAEFELRPVRPFYDPLAPGGPALVRTGLRRRGNPDLEPEESTLWNVGLSWSPTAVPGFSLVADYTHIDYKNRVVSGAAVIRDLPPEAVAPRRDLIIRDEEGNAITQDWSPINEYERVSKDLSIDMAYGFYSKLGWFEPGINYYRVLELHDQYSSELESVDFVGTSRGPDDYRLRGRIAWRRNDWSALLGINYTPDYQNNQVEIADGGPAAQHKVDSYTTADLTMAYRAKSGLTLRAGGMNITDADFPLAILDRQIAGASPYDPSRVDPRGRVLFFEMEYEF